MKKKSLGFIGAGRITRIFLQAFQNKKVSFEKTVVFDVNSETCFQLKKQFPEIEISDIEKVAAQEYVFIALHPPIIMETLDKIAQFVTSKTIIISLAPKIKIAGIASKLNHVTRIVRIIPNATSIINEGYNPVFYSTGISSQEKAEIHEMLSILGKTFEVPEAKLEAYAIVSAMAPTYFWFQWKKLADIGVDFGMDVAESDQAVYETLLAALHVFYKSIHSREEVFNLIPVKPIGEHEDEINNIFEHKLKGLYSKLVS